MKEMVYQANRKIEVLDTGICNGFTYYILNLGTHPTAYIKIPENHKYYKDRNYDNIDIYVHGGLTYSDNHLWIAENEAISGQFIGWDYAHAGDYLGFYEKYPLDFVRNEKRWTIQEIYDEVKEVCKQLNEV